MTLRVRLLLGLVVLAAIGLAVAGGVTYHEQQTFFSKRVKAQLTSAVANPRQFRVGVSGPGGDDSPQQVPFGTYAEFRFRDGTIVPASNDQVSSAAKPALPDTVVLGRIFTVHNPNYRVLASEVTFLPSGTSATLVVAIPLHDMNESLHRLLLVELVVTAAVLLVLALMAWWVIKFGLRPLENMQKTAVAIAAGDLSRRVEVVDENTEVGRLGVALNDMMQQIETAFDARAASEGRLRRFIGDASHELRTPLTSIRGYAELFRRGAADRPEDLAKAMRRIEEEADRMGSLVDDMLLLARLDQGRPLEHHPVDLVHLASDAVDDARAVNPDRPLDFVPSAPVFVPGDEMRIRQVLGNLLQNANRHTPPDTPVHVRVISDETEVAIEVADEGPGMSAENTSHVFERFWRSDPARTRSSGGAGLGLAIVAAIAAAHGGRAEVTSELGRGSTFRVYFPRQAPPNADAYVNGVSASDGYISPVPATDLPPNDVPVVDIDEP